MFTLYAIVSPLSDGLTQLPDRVMYDAGVALIFSSESDARNYLVKHADLYGDRYEVEPVLVSPAIPVKAADISPRPWRVSTTESRPLRILAADSRDTIVAEISGSSSNPISIAEAHLICALVNGALLS